MSKPKDNTNPDNPDFSALHDDSRTEVFNRPRRRGHGMPPQQPAQQVAPAPVEESSGLSSGLTKVLGAAALIVAIASLVVAISTVVFVTKKHDDPDLAALLAAANYNNSAQQRLGSSHSHRSQSSKPGASNHGGSATTAGAPAAPPVNAAPNNPAPAAPADDNNPDADTDKPNTDTETDGSSRGWKPSSPLPSDFAVTTNNPTVDDFNAIVYFLTATDAPDAAKARNIETPDAIVVPRTVSQLGLFRPPRGGSRISGPIVRNGNQITVHLNSFSQGMPEVSMDINFVYIGGNWRLADSSMCSGVRTVGLPIYCNA